MQGNQLESKTRVTRQVNGKITTSDKHTMMQLQVITKPKTENAMQETKKNNSGSVDPGGVKIV